MPYHSRVNLPKTLRGKLPPHAQEIYQKAYDSAFHEYRSGSSRTGASREEVAHRVAWAAVKQKYRKGEDEKWHRK